LRSRGSYTLAAGTWPRTWFFRNYSEILVEYSRRTLSYESDKLNAISGCLDVLGQNGEVKFVAGLPSADFHYAMLWYGEYDRPRKGFPSWSWAGWRADMQAHFILPNNGPSGFLSPVGDGNLEYKDNSAPHLVHLAADFLPKPHRSNRCSQHLASILLSESSSTVRVSSEVAKFFLDITKGPDLGPVVAGIPARGKWPSTERWADIPHDFDTNSANTSVEWDPETQYLILGPRIRFRDSWDIYPRNESWENHWPLFFMGFPSSLRGSTLTWLLRDGIELIKIIEVELISGDASVLPFHRVLCLGIDRSECIPDHGRRMGVFCIPKQWWKRAEPEEMVVTFM
jgi:hypothetical protein